jgi:hypothetical protein
VELPCTLTLDDAAATLQPPSLSALTHLHVIDIGFQFAHRRYLPSCFALSSLDISQCRPPLPTTTTATATTGGRHVLLLCRLFFFLCVCMCVCVCVCVCGVCLCTAAHRWLLPLSNSSIRSPTADQWLDELVLKNIVHMPQLVSLCLPSALPDTSAALQQRCYAELTALRRLEHLELSLFHTRDELVALLRALTALRAYFVLNMLGRDVYSALPPDVALRLATMPVFSLNGNPSLWALCDNPRCPATHAPYALPLARYIFDDACVAALPLERDAAPGDEDASDGGEWLPSDDDDDDDAG